jgi:DNA repair protein RecO (recombination protein O)
LLAFCLPEREAQPELYAQTRGLLDALPEPGWERLYLLWERALLEALGFGLSLESCALTGVAEDLVYVSPRTGRAVSREAGAEWADRLLPLPGCLRGGQDASLGELSAGLATTGHFLERHVAPSFGTAPLPAARRRLLDLLSRGSC